MQFPDEPTVMARARQMTRSCGYRLGPALLLGAILAGRRTGPSQAVGGVVLGLLVAEGILKVCFETRRT